MKKITLICAVLAAVVLSSCGTKKNVNGWYEDFEVAKKEAQSKNKNILLFVNSDMDVEGTKDGIEFLLSSPDFTKSMKDKYICVHFDFTDLSAAMAEVPAGATDKEQKASEKNKKRLDNQFRIADTYMIQSTPSVILITKEGYFITDVSLDFIGTSVEGYVSSIALEDGTVKEVTDMVAATEKGSKIDRVKAIDKLYESQSETHRLMLADLYRKVPSLDKKNTTGLVGKYIVALAHADAYKYLIDGNVESAVKIYESSAKNKKIAAEDSQILYYMAANFLSSTRTGDVSRIVELLEKAISVAPESEYVSTLQNILASVKSMQEENNAPAAEEQKESASSENKGTDKE